MLRPILFALATGAAWGFYGPTLAQARTYLQSPFKPYVMIGLAYLLIAIIGGLGMMWYRGESFTFAGKGSYWALAAGALGAIGALTLTFAMFTGGNKMPHVVMPIVFGGAVTVSAIVSWWQTRGAVTTPPMLWLGIAIVLVGAITVAYNTPHPHPPAKKPAAPAVAQT